MKKQNGIPINKVSERGVKSLIQMKNEVSIQNNIQDKRKNDIIKVLIYIYYYEKEIFNVNKGINFNNKEKYYLIKSAWIKEFKNYYDYQKISKFLDKFQSNNQISLVNLSNNDILERIITYLNNCCVDLLSKQSSNILKNSDIRMLPIQLKQIFIYYSNCYIINSTILEIFEKYLFEGQIIKIKPINIFNKENNIFLSLTNKNIVFVTIGNFNQELIFDSISCLLYKDPNIFETEKNNLLNQSFKDYIKSRKCQENDFNIQNLINGTDKNDPEIGKFFSINKIKITKLKNHNITRNKSISPKIAKKKLIEKIAGNNITFHSSKKINNQSLKKIIFANSSIGRNRTPENTVKTKKNLNKNIQNNSKNLGQIQEEPKKNQKNESLNLKNKDNNIEDNEQKEQKKDLLHQQKLKNLQNELDKKSHLINNYKNEDSKNKRLIAQLRKENNNLMEKDKKNQEQIKILISSNNEREKQKDEKNKNILNEKEIKIEELEKEVSRLKNLLNDQSQIVNEIEKLKNECNELKSENLEKDNQIKTLKVEIDNKNKDKENELENKINENIELQRNNEELKKELSNNKKLQNDLIKESKQKDEQLQKLKNENQINMEEKEKQINNLQKDNENLKKIEKELKEKINSKIDELKKKDDEINNLNKKYQEFQKELENEKNINNELKEKEDEEKKIYQSVMMEKDNLQNQLKEKEEIIDTLNAENRDLKNKISNEIQNKTNFEEEYNTKKKEINEKFQQISNKEKEINDKISFLEDKENLFENENKEFINNKKLNEELKKENIKLTNENKELENQIKQKKMQLCQNIGNVNEGNNCLLYSLEPNQINNYIDSNKQSLNLNQSQNQSYQMINYNPLPPKEKEPLELYQEPTLIGLNNIGATCFMNSTLQCLSQTKSLTNYFLKKSKFQIIMNNNIAKQNKNLPQLSPVYLKLIKMLWDKNKKGSSFSPNDFMETVGKMNPLFKKGQAGDSKDFIIFILEQIHKELKRPVNSKNQIIVQPLNQYDRNNAFTYFMNDFQKECSIISDIFFGFTETTNICLYCKNVYSSQGKNYPICYNYGIFNCLIFPLEEVKNFRNNYWANLNIQINQNNIVTLSECFFYNQKTEMFTGDNRNYCNICKQLYDSEYTNRIYSSPNVLILILNRGKDNKYNIKLDFTETFDLTQFVVVKDRSPLIYNLNGVITHYGQSGPNAHFIGFCKSPINNKWYKYNDAFVNLVEDVQKEIINFGTPYILFYQKSN